MPPIPNNFLSIDVIAKLSRVEAASCEERSSTTEAWLSTETEGEIQRARDRRLAVSSQRETTRVNMIKVGWIWFLYNGNNKMIYSYWIY